MRIAAIATALVVLGGCARQPEHRAAAATQAAPTPQTAGATAGPANDDAHGPKMIAAIVRSTGAVASDTPGAVVDAKSATGALLLVRTPTQPPPAVTVARLGTARAAGKLVNAAAILGAIEAARERDPELHVYLQVDRERATHTSLASVGFAADTIAGDVATGWVRVTSLERVLASDIVHHLELPATARPR